MAGEEDCKITDIVLENVEIIMEKQGTQSHIPFDEQPSIYNVYNHSIPFIYARHVDNLEIKNSKGNRIMPGFPEWGNPIELESCKACKLDFYIS